MILDDACMSDGLRVYAIGDIHGCVDELKALIGKIDAYEKNAPSESHKLIFVGDYVDRGPANKQVINYMISLVNSKRDCVFLKGNHDQRFQDFCKNPHRVGEDFIRWGGGPTLRDYSVVPHPGESYNLMGERLSQNMPPEHMNFLESLELSHTLGDYFFCHAGIRPGVALEDQSSHDLMRIRADFLEETKPFEKIIIHGHTICDLPEVRQNRINIDTGCYQSGRLTAVLLEGNAKNFIHT